MTASISPLELSYRRLLRAYPRGWRQQRLDEVLSVLLDDAAGANRHRPSVADWLDLIGHGLAARLGLWIGHIPSGVRRDFGRLSFTSGVALSTALLILAELRWGPPTANDQVIRGTVGPFLSLSAITYLGWIAGFVAALCGNRRWFRTIAALTLISLPVTMAISAEFGLQRAPFALLATLGCLNIGALFVDPRPGLAWRGWSFAAVTLGLIALLEPADDLFSRSVGDQRYGFYWMIDSNYRLTTIAHTVPAAAATVIAVALLGSFILRYRQTACALMIATICWIPLAFADHHMSLFAVALLCLAQLASLLAVVRLSHIGASSKWVRRLAA